jgi:glycosyltransferase involved in cell wall biosynthesis
MKKNMHIAFIDFDSLHNPLLSGGQARATFEVAKRMVKNGHKVTILTSRYPASFNRTYQGVSYRHIGLGTKNLVINNLAFFLSIPFNLYRLQADVIIECFMAPISTSFAPLFTKTPVVGMPTMFEAEQFAKKYHFPFHKIEAFGCTFYKYFLAYSPLNKKKMELYNPSILTRIIPNGVGEEFFTVKETDGDYLLFIGRIDFFQKGLDLLIKAMKQATKKHPIKLIIAGNGPEEERLIQTIKNAGLEKYITFIGRVDGEKKLQLIANSRAGIYPSRFEDFPLVPLEFASMGKPLIRFDINGMQWVPETVSVIAKQFSIKSLADAIITISTDTSFRRKLKNNCRAFAKPYGWNGIAKQYEAFCREIIGLEKAKSLNPLRQKRGVAA